MKALLTFLLSLLCLTASASPGQPYFVRSLPGQTRFTPLDVPGLAYWWVASDVATNQFVTNWVDRIQGATMYQTLSARRPYPSTNAVIFSGGQILTNDIGFQQSYPVAYFVKMSFAHNGVTFQTVINDLADTSSGPQGMLINTDDGIYQNMAGSVTAASGPLLINRSFSFLTIPTNPPGTYGLVYTNGVATGLQWNENGVSIIKLRAFGGNTRSDPPDSFLNGAIHEIAVWTNAWSNVTNVFTSTMVSNMMWYATNPTYVEIYAQPQWVLCDTNDIANFSITAVGDALTYQWRTNGVGLSNSSLWSGVTASVLWVTNNGTVFSNLSVDCVVANSYGSLTSSAAYLNVVSDTNLFFGLTGWWRFDDGSGGTALDSTYFLSPTASVHNGTLTNSPTWITNGAVGGALQLNGSSQSVGIGNGALTNVNNFTIASWVNAAADATGGEIFSDFGQTRCLGQEAADCFAEVSISSAYRLVFGPSIRGTGWRHLTMVKSSTTGLSLYIDGTLSTNNATYTGDCSVLNNNQTIGMTPDNQFRLKGSVDEVRVYNRVLSATEITNLFNWRP